MGANIRPEPTVFVIFGAAGDLSWRKLIPAIYSLYVDGWLPEKFRIIGTGHQHMEEEAFHSHLKTGVGKYARRTLTEEGWSRFAAHLTFMTADLEQPEVFGELARKLAEQDREWNGRANRIFYLSLPPTMIEPVARELARAKLNQDRLRDRIVVEKPFGRDLDSARTLNRNLSELFRESQIFRIDHYLGKETVQNIMAFRFANTLFEPVWNRNYIDHVQITVAEAEGVGSRGHYYDQAGALRDMIQNHLLQILCLIAMEPPVSFSADEVRNKKADVLHAIRPINPERVFKSAVRGQYGAGWIESQHVDAYRGATNVAPDSVIETFAAVKLQVDNWRWQGVPFYLRTGKRLPAKISEVSIQFKPVPHQPFPATAIMDCPPQPAGHSHPARRGHLAALRGQVPGTHHASLPGNHAVLLPGGLQIDAAGGLRDPAA